MSVLMIGATEREKIQRIIAQAMRSIMPLELVSQGVANGRPTLTHRERSVLGERFELPPSAHIEFPGGCRAAFSMEVQPVGTCSHLSVSVNRAGWVPDPSVVKAVAEEFGVPYPATGSSWVEEFAPGEYAVNLVSPL